MHKKLVKFVIVISSLLLITGVSASAGVYDASLAKMPVYAESPEKGVLVDFTKALAEVSGNDFNLRVVPFKRSMHNVTTRAVDFHMPLIQNPALKDADLDYDHSTTTIFHVNFVLYTNKNKPLDIKDLSGAKIETEAAHTQYFHKEIKPSSNIENSLKKVNVGRIDGFIFADNASDPIVKKLGLKNIKRQLYKRFDVKIILPKGEQDKEVDHMLTAAVEKLKQTGQYKKIMGIIDAQYNDWQP